MAAESDSLHRRLYLLGVQLEELDQALEEVLRVLVNSRPAFKGDTAFSVFCFGVAARVVGARVRRHARRNNPRDESDIRGPLQLHDEDSTMNSGIDAALNLLPFRMRVLLVAVDMQDMSLDELAYALNVSDTACHRLESQLQRARVMFARALEAADDSSKA